MLSVTNKPIMLSVVMLNVLKITRFITFLVNQSEWIFCHRQESYPGSRFLELRRAKRFNHRDRNDLYGFNTRDKAMVWRPLHYSPVMEKSNGFGQGILKGEVSLYH